MLTKNYTPIIIILIFIIISLTLVLIFGLWKPKHVEKYIAKLQNVRENLKFTGSEIPFEDLYRIIPFDFFLTGEQESNKEQIELAYQEMIDNIQVLFLERDN